MEKIVILEFIDEVKSFLNYCQNQSLSIDDFQIITLEPKVQVFLKKLNISMIIIIIIFRGLLFKKMMEN